VVEPKEKLRERLGRSPDCGDAVALALFEPRGLLSPEEIDRAFAAKKPGRFPNGLPEKKG
jgi:hypothetical protein